MKEEYKKGINELESEIRNKEYEIRVIKGEIRELKEMIVNIDYTKRELKDEFYGYSRNEFTKEILNLRSEVKAKNALIKKLGSR